MKTLTTEDIEMERGGPLDGQLCRVYLLDGKLVDAELLDYVGPLQVMVHRGGLVVYESTKRNGVDEG